jgi:hypothetical protein
MDIVLELSGMDDINEVQYYHCPYFRDQPPEEGTMLSMALSNRAWALACRLIERGGTLPKAFEFRNYTLWGGLIICNLALVAPGAQPKSDLELDSLKDEKDTESAAYLTPSGQLAVNI